MAKKNSNFFLAKILNKKSSKKLKKNGGKKKWGKEKLGKKNQKS